MKPLINLNRRRASRSWWSGALRLLTFVVLVISALTPVAAFADDAAPVPDGRMIGYSTAVNLPDPGGTTGTWIILIFLGLVVAAVLFKNSSRSHLD